MLVLILLYNVMIVVGIGIFWYWNNTNKKRFKKYFLKFYYANLIVTFFIFYVYNDNVYDVGVFATFLVMLVNLVLSVIWMRDWRNS